VLQNTAAAWFGIDQSSTRCSGTQQSVPPNKPLQRSGNDKLQGRGHSDGVLNQALRDRVLEHTRSVAERGS
jgi:hypothetical protein